MREMLRLLSLTLVIFLSANLAAQETGDQETGEEALPAPSGSLIDPVFPESNTAIVQFEAEEAVSTNFAKSPTLDYSASGSRTLQLNRYTELFGNAAFYAEYVFFVEERGTYDLYYGGTPPGPADEVFPSYASPFSYTLDQGQAVEVYREDVNVIERYSPNYYWVKFGNAELRPGVHRIRIEVREKRKYDGKFFFYLDTLLFIDAARFDRAAGVPAVFPRNPDNRSIDTPMKTFNDYRYLVTVEPENVDNYIEFSLVYALTGDYLNALRNANRAMLFDPENTEARLLAAKYRLWKGEADEALKTYDTLLEMQPDLREAWAEAGKVAAWIGRYEDSIDYYTRALGYFPDDLNLAVNKAITLLWASREPEAEEIFGDVEAAAAADADQALELGEILVANGYPDRAISFYLRSIDEHPEYVELYLRLVQAYAEAGQAEKSSTVYDEISKRFVSSGRLDALLESFAVKESMKEQVIEGFTDALAGNPDNLALREQLVQAYFWNGLRKKAIEEYHNIIVNQAYITLSGFDRRSAELFELMDTLSVFKRRYGELPPEIKAHRSELEAAFGAYTAAQNQFEKFDQKVKKAKDAGNPPPEPEGEHPQVVLNDAQSVLADSAALASEYLRWIRAFTQDSEALLDKRNAIAAEEQESRDSFVRLIAGSGWRWNREQTIGELKQVSASGFVLADYVLGRIYSVGEQYASARSLLEPVAATGDAPAGYAVIQNSLWGG
ncbi:MAG: tetratricopeptide repeat protein, partial [Spirochaetales bacterium]|nr:tetratricopeptide repeat protein [Spirochaetales bacterium]